MDTEFDRQCAKTIVALNYSRSVIERSGLRAETAKKSLEGVLLIVLSLACKSIISSTSDHTKQ